MEKQGFVTIDEVILERTAEAQENTLHNYIWRLHYGLTGFQQLQMKLGYNITHGFVDVGPTTKRFPIPDDCIDGGIYLIGQIVGDRVVPYTPDNSLALRQAKENTPNKPYRSVPESDYKILSYFYPYISSPELEGYGYGHNGMGYYRFDDVAKEVQMSAEVTAKTVYIEYVTSGFNANSDTMIPVTHKDYLKTYMEWCEVKNKFGSASVEAKNLERDLFYKKIEIKALKSDLSGNALVECIHRNFGSWTNRW